MKNNLFYVFVMVFLFFPSCRNALDGYATPPGFLKKEWELSGEIQDFTLTAKNEEDWWLGSLNINREHFHPDTWENDARIIIHSSKAKDPDRPHIYHFGIYKIEFEDWFVWERQGNKTIRIRLTENESGKDREVHFQASVGNASDDIYIVQKAKN